MMVEDKQDPPEVSPPLAVEAPNAEDPPPSALNASAEQGNPPDEESNHIQTKGGSSDSTDSASNALEDTFLEGESDADESDNASNKGGRGRRKRITQYASICAILSLMIAAAVVAPLLLRTDNSEGTSDTASTTAAPHEVVSGEQLQQLSGTEDSVAPPPEEPPQLPEGETDPPTKMASSPSPSEEEAPLPIPLPGGTDSPTFNPPTTAPPEEPPLRPALPEGKTDTPTTAAPTPPETLYSTPRRTEEASDFTVILQPVQTPSGSPTMAPITDEPTPNPTPNPTQRTYKPTPQPTQTVRPLPGATPNPTPNPSPKPTPRRTPRPTATPSPFDITKSPLFRYLNVLGTPADVLANPNTPQGKAIRWLMEPGVETISVFRVPQRFALVALDFALHEQEIKVLSAWQAYINAVQGQSYTPWRQKRLDACAWEGVTCNDQNEVIGIKWSQQGLKGKIIPEITLLSKLQVVDLAENQIRGTLDPFWDLPELTHLYLFQNRFSGQIPADRSAPTNLHSVYLGHNDLTGPLPLTLTSSRFKGPGNLKYLILHHNQLNGTLPEGMRLRNLFYLDLSNNDFHGPVPSDWVFYMQQLRFLYMGNNRLSGELPYDFDEIGNGRLKQLFIENNRFSGEFPTKSWDSFFMTNMNIQGNNFDKAKNLCKISVFEGGELVELRADCDLCWCESLCQNCVAVWKQQEQNSQKVAKGYLIAESSSSSSSPPESTGSP